jgi:streptomycin 6-kinase
VDIVIPAYLPRNLREYGFGDAGTRWLADLPRHIAALAQEWDLRVGPPFDQNGTVSWVAPVDLRDGSEAVLKITVPHEEARDEAAALSALDGRGAVHLLRSSDDGFALLLERCRPGTDLWPLGEEEGQAVACRLLPRLWRAPAPDASFVPLAAYVAGWWDGLPRLTASAAGAEELVSAAVARGRALVASQPQRVLLHGDFHPGNVLAAQREPWLGIDPKPLVGEPAYDLAQWLANQARDEMQPEEVVPILRHQIERFAAELGLDPARIAGWAFVKALGWEWGAASLRLFHTLAQAW